MEIIRNSPSIEGCRDHVFFLRLFSISIFILIYFCIGIIAYQHLKKIVDYPFIWACYYTVGFPVILSIILLLNRYISFPPWYMWIGPIVEINGENFEDIREYTSWLNECMPKSSKYIVGERYKMVIMFKHDSDLVMFKTAW